MASNDSSKSSTYTLSLASQQQSMLNAIKYVREASVNPTEFGSFVEQTFRSSLAAALPQFVGVTNGFVEDVDGHRSQQMDVILYDKTSASALLDSGSWKVLPVECTYACCEVKTKMTASTLKADVAEKCRSYKRLRRLAAIGPQPVEVKLFGERGPWRSLFFSLGYESAVSKGDAALRSELSQGDVHSRIDAMFALKPKGPGMATALINVEGGVGSDGVPADSSVMATPTSDSQLCSYRSHDTWALAVALVRRAIVVPSLAQVDLPRYLALGSDARSPSDSATTR